MSRFFLSDLEKPALLGTEAHHAVHVLRLNRGDTINVFDGRGHEAQARIEQIGRDSVALTILRHSKTAAPPCRITLAQAVPKKNMDYVVQKATELGITAILPLISDRTVVRLDENSKKLERWREIALDACKQCGNNWLPEIQPPQPIAGFLKAVPEFDLKLIGSLQVDAKPLKEILTEVRILQRSQSPSVLLLIGPEGDFTPAELSHAKSVGCHALSLGPLVLRADTAALYALSIVRHELQKR